jgi:chloride channel 3/4/5
MWRSFISAMVASIFLKIVNPFRTGKLVMFQVTYTRNWHGFEMIFFLILGVLGGLYGTLFIKLNLWLTKFRRDSWLNKYPIQEVIAITLITSAIGFPNIFMRLDTSELLSNLFTECDDNSLNILCPKSNIFKTITLLLIASLLKLLLTIVTFGVRIPAGLFLPSMAIGACVGRVVGIIVQELSKNSQSFFFQSCQVGTNCINPGTYAMVGAAAALGGVTRMTVSLVVIMFELTGALTYVLPIMVAVMTSKWVGDAFDRGGIYDGLIRLNGYPFLHNKQDYPSDHTTGQVMTRVNDLVVIPADQISLSQIDELLQYTNFKGFPIVRSSNDPFLIGFISRSELRTGIEHAKLSSTVDGSSPCLFDIVDSDSLGILEHGSFVDLRYWTDHTPITVTPTTTMGVVIDLFCKLGLRYVLVAKHGELLGVITKKDVLKHIDIIEYPKLAQRNNIA